MKKASTFSLVLLFCAHLQAQKITRYETFIYTDEQLSTLIQEEERTRGYGSDLLQSTLNTAIAGTGGFVAAFFDMGFSTVTSLLTKSKEDQKKWEEIISAENVY